MTEIKHILTMYPDYGENCFYTSDGFDCGENGEIWLDDGFMVKINVPGLSEWCYKYQEECLIPVEAGEISIEELNKTFDWKDFHTEGLRLAYEVKKQLPEDLELWYQAPYEDKSGLIPEKILITVENNGKL